MSKWPFGPPARPDTPAPPEPEFTPTAPADDAAPPADEHPVDTERFHADPELNAAYARIRELEDLLSTERGRSRVWEERAHASREQSRQRAQQTARQFNDTYQRLLRAEEQLARLGVEPAGDGLAAASADG